MNILQVSTAFESTINDHISDMNNASQSLSSSSGYVSNNSSSQNSSTIRKELSNSSSSSKTGRPILGKYSLASLEQHPEGTWLHLFKGEYKFVYFITFFYS